jgi:hypothetical protein
MGVPDAYLTVADIDATCAAIGDIQPSIREADVQLAIDAATELIWHMTGRQFGIYTDDEIILMHDHNHHYPGWCTLDLTRYPVLAIKSISVGANTYPVSGVAVSGKRLVHRNDGSAWPEFTTITVIATWGRPVPAMVRRAAERLTCELLSLRSNRPSALGDRVRSVSRQGVSMELVSSEDLLSQPGGRTGIYEIDLALATYNEQGHNAMPMVISVDTPSPQGWPLSPNVWPTSPQGYPL